MKAAAQWPLCRPHNLKIQFSDVSSDGETWVSVEKHGGCVNVETGHCESLSSSTDIIENYFVVGNAKQEQAVEGSSGYSLLQWPQTVLFSFCPLSP